MRHPRAAGGCRRRSIRSIRAIVEMLLAYEDQRFRSHPGVDPLAMARAALQFIDQRAHRVGRLDDHHAGGAAAGAAHRAQLAAKLRQMVRAISSSGVLTKDEMLGALSQPRALRRQSRRHSRRVARPISARSRAGFRMAEAALLVALPQSPELRRPDRSAAAARAARDRVLDRIAAAGRIPADEVALRQARRRAEWPQADAGAGAACGRSGRRGDAAAQNPSADHRRAAAEDRCRTWRASGRGRSAPTSRSRSSRSITRPARCWRASPRPIISTSAAPARST